MQNPTTVTLGIGKSKVTVTPGHGATVAELVLGGRDILYPEYSFDKAGVTKYRGGAPILFPNAGTLKPGSPFELGQHGFGRGAVWRVASQTNRSVTTVLESSAETVKVYPFEFRLEQTVELTETAMKCRLSVTNTGQGAMPVSLGWHHYFAVANLQTGTLSQFLPRDYQPDTILRYDWPGAIDFNFDGIDVRFSASSQFGHLVVWSDQPEKYICFEPWEREQTDLSPKSATMIKPSQTVQFDYHLTIQPRKANHAKPTI